MTTEANPYAEAIESARGGTGQREGRGAKAPRSSSFGSPAGLMVKIGLLGLLNAMVIWGLPRMFDKPDYGLAIAAIVALVVIDVIYLSPRRFIPGKYLIPGTVFLVAFAVYPVIYTVYISTTNYGTGNILSKGQAVTQIEQQSIGSTTDATRYTLQILAEGDVTGPLAYLLTDPDGNWFLGTADGLQPLTPDQIVEQGRRKTVEGYVALNAGQAQDRVAEIQAFAVPGPDGDIVNDGFGNAFVKVQRFRFDAATNTMVDTVDDVVYRPEGGFFVSESGQRLLPGWRAGVGLDNYQRLFTDPDVRGPFLRVFVWTVVFASMSVVTTFALGLLLALVFNNDRMKGRRLYRSLIIIPYALPSFMTALVWKGMFNQQFGVVNRWLGTSLPWLDGQWLPYFSILLVNLWLGYPYMFLVCTGALQSIPSDLKEAAVVDGATGWKAFKRVTFPLLLIAVSPLLIASFAFNFNNFNLIYLLTEGKPPIPGSDAGRTDILISYTYKLAFGGGRGADYGFASAVSLVIFILVAGISAFSFRYTKTFEEVK
jgi:arabinogalactan oligomer/maltooligosaccharide transport system permease protein